MREAGLYACLLLLTPVLLLAAVCTNKHPEVDRKSVFVLRLAGGFYLETESPAR